MAKGKTSKSFMLLRLFLGQKYTKEIKVEINLVNVVTLLAVWTLLSIPVGLIAAQICKGKDK